VVNQRTLNFLVDTGLVEINSLSNTRCHFTHESEASLAISGTVKNLLRVAQVLVLNQSVKQTLITLGIDSNNIKVIYGAIDRDVFKPSLILPTKEYVLISGDAKGRKNPSKVMKLIESCPEIDFAICGRGWEKYFDRTIPANLEIHEFDLASNAKLMREASSYLTLSLEEGGPYPILEALASGTPVVSTPVGWVPELINNSNGIVIPIDCNFMEIRNALKNAMALKSKVYGLDLLDGKFTWEEQAELLFSQLDC